MKLKALKRGLTISIREGFTKLILEADSLIIIKMLGKMLHGSSISKISTSLRMEGGLERLQSCLPLIGVIIPSHICHSTNKLSDRLVNG